MRKGDRERERERKEKKNKADTNQEVQSCFSDGQ